MSKIFLGTSFLVAAAGVALLPAGGCTAPAASDPHGEVLDRVSSALGDGGDEDAGVAPKRGDLVISQVYGGGGEVGATYQHDFVELFNRSKSRISLNGLSLQYAGSTNDFSVGNVLPLTGSVPPGGYVLIGLGTADPAVGAALPLPDQSGGLQLGVASGKVALAPTLTPLACGGATRCERGKLLDLVGYGAVTDFEGAQSVLPLEATKSAARKGDGCTDTEDNRADFTLETPVPRSSANAANPCSSPPPKDGGGSPSPVVDPPLGAELPYDAGARRDAGANGRGASPDTSSGCSFAGQGPRSHARAAFGLALATALAFSARRRRASAR